MKTDLQIFEDRFDASDNSHFYFFFYDDMKAMGSLMAARIELSIAFYWMGVNIRQAWKEFGEDISRMTQRAS